VTIASNLQGGDAAASPVMPRDGSVFDLFSERENESLKSVSRVFQDVLTR